MRYKVNKLVLLDDDPSMNYVNKFLLERHEFAKTIIVEQYSEEVLKKFSVWQDHPEAIPEILLLDLNMPVIDGHQMLELLEKMGGAVVDKLHVYVLTSSDSKRDVNRALKSKLVKGYLAKPLNVLDLEEILKPYRVDTE